MSPMNPRLLRPRAKGFDPRQIAGLAMWVNPADASTLTYNGTSISQASDASGNSRHIVQPTAASQPRTAVVNGRTALSFDGTSQWMRQNALSDFANRTTVLVVSRNGVNARYGAIVNYRSSATAVSGVSNSDVAFGVANDNPTTNTGTLNLVSASGVGPAWVNGISAVISSTAYATQALSPSGVEDVGRTSILIVHTGQSASGGKQILVGVEGNSASRLYGMTLCEALVYSQELTTAQRQKLEGYLAWKWGLQASLPYDHPYAASFPGYGTQATPTDADALAYLSAVRTADGGTGVEVGVANAVDSFVKGCKSDGTWSAIKASCILAGARTLSGALVPLAGSAPTNVNFVAADYNRKTGLIGDGSTKYLDSNRANNADPQNDNHNAVYVTTANGSGTQGYLGSGAGSAGTNQIFTDSGNTTMRSRFGATTNAYTGTPTGFVGHARQASSDIVGRLSGATTTRAIASETPATTNLTLFRLGTFGAYANGRVSFYSIGTYLDLALLDTRITRLINEAQYTLNTGLSGSSYATETLAYINAGYAAGGTLA